MATKKAAKKTETVKNTAVKTEQEKTSAVKPAAAAVTADDKVTTDKKAATEKKPAAKKAVKSPAAKKEMKVKTVVEYSGRQVEEKDIIASVKKAWTKSGGKVGDIKSVDLYIKPEESAVYYVINKTETGAVAF